MSTIQNSELIHPLLAQRWSPVIFDAQRDVSPDDMHALLDAARWAPSCFNAQPWRFIVAVKSRAPQLWQQIHQTLAEGNQGWTQAAPVLLMGLVKTHFEHNGKANAHAIYDLGAAAAHMTVEASSRGILLHQMAGFSPEKAVDLFDLEDGLVAVTAMALGYHGDVSTADQSLIDREAGARERKSLDQLLLNGSESAIR